jgi:hypothetical protein
MRWIQGMRRFVDVEDTIWSCGQEDSDLNIELHAVLIRLQF